MIQKEIFIIDPFTEQKPLYRKCLVLYCDPIFEFKQPCRWHKHYKPKPELSKWQNIEIKKKKISTTIRWEGKFQQDPSLGSCCEHFHHMYKQCLLPPVNSSDVLNQLPWGVCPPSSPSPGASSRTKASQGEGGGVLHISPLAPTQRGSISAALSFATFRL